MSMIPGFASGSNLVIKIEGDTVAYGTNFSWSDDVAHSAVGGIGSYSYDALEPLQYLARGSFSIVRYSSAARAAIGDSNAPARSTAGVTGSDGNSMLKPNSFNPTILILSRSFDIDIYERGSTGGPANKANKDANAAAQTSAEVGNAIFKIQDCRLTSYSITFTPGQLVSENIGFICIRAKDLTVPGNSDKN